MKRLTILLLALLMKGVLLAQPSDRKADSLLGIWNDPSKPDTTRLRAMNRMLMRTFHRITPDSVVRVGELMYSFAKEEGVKSWYSSALVARGNGYLLKADYERAQADFELAMKACESQGDTAGMMAPLNGLSSTCNIMGNKVQAIKHLMRALRIAEARNDSSILLRTLGNLALGHEGQNDLVAASEMYRRAIDLATARKDSTALLNFMHNYAGVLRKTGNAAAAERMFDDCLRLAELTGNDRVILVGALEAGRRRSARAEYDSAMHYFDRAMSIALATSDSGNLASVNAEIASCFLAQGLYHKALPYTEQAVNIAQRIHDLPVLRDAANAAYAVRKAAGDVDGALAMLELYYTTRDSLSNDVNKQAVIEQRLQYDFEKKEALQQAEQDKKDALAAQELRRKKLQRNAFIGGFGLMVLLAGTFFFQRNRINREKKRSEELLLNILPEEVAEELKAKGSAEAVHIDQVTVLFTDFKGFTAMSETMSPQEIVRDLNECFSTFDRITEKYGIEKIKTIGDAYMAAGGLPTPNTTHATDVIKAAFEMRDLIAEAKARKIAAGFPYFEIRIGIHTGPVVAGIVGVKKFQYDIWGDTVNTASRMESSGEVGKVNISEATYALVRNVPGLTFTSRGRVQAKGKGEMEMYFVGSAIDTR